MCEIDPETSTGKDLSEIFASSTTTMTKSSSNYRAHVESSSKEEETAEFEVDPAMKAEIEAAVGFLTDFLVKSPKHEFSQESVDFFRRSLQSVLCRHYRGHWHSMNPLKGSGFRCLRINGKLDPLVARAAEASLLPLRKVRQAFPAELTVWVDPGDVSVRFGEEGSIGVWYAARRSVDEEEQAKKQLFEEHHRAYPHQMYQRQSPTLSSTPPGMLNGGGFPSPGGGYHRVHYHSSPVQYPRQQQSSPAWGPHWQQQHAVGFSQQNRSSPSSFITTTSGNNGFNVALNHQQQQSPFRYNNTSAILSSPSSRVSPQLGVQEFPATVENGEEQRCKMLAERLMRENLNLMAGFASGLAPSRSQPVGVGVN